MMRDCHNSADGLSKIYWSIFAGIILLTHYSLLVSVENFRGNPDVQFQTYLFILPQCLISATIFFGLCSSLAVRILAVIFILNQWSWGAPYSNHHILLTFVSLAFIICRNDRELRSSIRMLLVVSYLFTVVYKLNTSFVDPAQSCADLFIENTAQSLFGTQAPAELIKLGPLLVLVAELSIPVLLLIPRLRPMALLIGILFHGALALDIPKHFFDFSALMIGALSIVCIPWMETERTPRQKLVLYSSAAVVAILPFLALWRLMSTHFMLNEADMLTLGTVALFLLIFGLAIYVQPIRCLREGTGHDLNLPTPATALPALLLALLCCGPVIGFRTRFSMDMYSGLELTAISSNHLFIPRSLDIFGYLGDIAYLRSSDSPGFNQRIKLRDDYMPFLELRRLYSAEPNARLRFTRNGDTIEVTPQTPYPPLSAPLSYLERTFFIFRPLSAPEREKCRW